MSQQEKRVVGQEAEVHLPASRLREVYAELIEYLSQQLAGVTDGEVKTFKVGELLRLVEQLSDIRAESNRQEPSAEPGQSATPPEAIPESAETLRNKHLQLVEYIAQEAEKIQETPALRSYNRSELKDIKLLELFGTENKPSIDMLATLLLEKAGSRLKRAGSPRGCFYAQSMMVAMFVDLFDGFVTFGNHFEASVVNLRRFFCQFLVDLNLNDEEKSWEPSQRFAATVVGMTRYNTYVTATSTRGSIDQTRLWADVASLAETGDFAS